MQIHWFSIYIKFDSRYKIWPFIQESQITSMFRGYFKEFKCHNIWLTGKKCPYKKIVKFWFETSKNYHCRCRTWGCKCLCPQVNATFSQKIKTALSFPELSFCFPELSFCLSEVFIYLMFLFFKNGFCHRWLYVLLFLL